MEQTGVIYILTNPSFPQYVNTESKRNALAVIQLF